MLSRPPLVLVAHDDEAIRNALKFMLELEGLDVHTLGDAAALLAYPGMSRARCLVLQDRMHNMDGIALLASLRARGVKAPAILVAGDARQAARARAGGMALVLEKPILDNALVEGVHAILSGGIEPAVEPPPPT